MNIFLCGFSLITKKSEKSRGEEKYDSDLETWIQNSLDSKLTFLFVKIINVFCSVRLIVRFHSNLFIHSISNKCFFLFLFYNSANNAIKHSNDQVHCPHICWSTAILAPSRASFAEKDSIKSLTWRNTPTFTRVSKVLRLTLDWSNFDCHRINFFCLRYARCLILFGDKKS